MPKNIVFKLTPWCGCFIFLFLQSCSDEHLSKNLDGATISAAEENVEKPADKKEVLLIDPPVEEEVVFVDEDLPVVDLLPHAPGPIIYPIPGGSGSGRHHRCGNGKREHVEECDDGNTVPFDGCEPVTCEKSFDCASGNDIGFIQNTPRYVSPTGDDIGDCTSENEPCKTIKYAITQAEPSDTLVLSEGTFHETDITVDKSLNIFGQGFDVTVVDGDDALNTIFTVEGVSAESTRVVICGLRITGGNDPDGGALVNNDARTTIINVDVSENRGEGANGANSTTEGEDGSEAVGAIFNAAELFIIDSIVSNNEAIGGNGGNASSGDDISTLGGFGAFGVGAIRNSGMLTIERSVLDGNKGFGGNGGDGTSGAAINADVEGAGRNGGFGVGAIYSDGPVTIRHSNAKNNIGAGGEGGDGFAENAAENRSAASFAQQGGFGVGVIFNQGSEVNIILSTFSSNRGLGNIGGDATTGDAVGATSTISAVSGAAGDGFGVILSPREQPVSVINSTFDGNEGIGAESGNATMGSGDSAVDIFDAVSTSGGGGYGFFSGHALSIEKSTVSNNRGIGKNAGSATAQDGDATGGFGGESFILNATTLSMFSSTVSGNEAISGKGGDAISTGGPADGGDGGDGFMILSFLTGSITNSTIFNNATKGGAFGTGSTSNGEVGDSNGGLYNNGTLTIGHTIVADNTPVDCSGNPVISLGHNLDSDATCAFDAEGDIQNVSPLLGVLADNGGPTKTHLPAENSPVIDSGDENCGDATITTDQRGEERPVSDSCDIGAVERQLEETL